MYLQSSIQSHINIFHGQWYIIQQYYVIINYCIEYLNLFL
jgi:hypothetical protein